MGEERSSPRQSRGHVGVVPAATSCSGSGETVQTKSSDPGPATIEDEMPVQLPTISRSLQKPVWQDGRRGHGNLLVHDENKSMKELQSTFQSDFVQHNLPPIPDLRSKVSALLTTAESAPFVPHTESRDNYAPFEMPKIRHRTRRGQIQIPKVPMEQDSSYKTEYISKKPEKRPAYLPREQDYRPTEPFSSTSIYQADFTRWDSLPTIGLSVSAPVRPSPPSAPAPEPSFDPDRSLQGCTDYRGNFKPWQTKRAATIAPAFRPPKEKFATETSYGTDFGPREQPKRTQLFRPPENDLKMRGKFDTLSLYRSDFVPKEIRPPSRQIYENRSSLMYPAVGRCGLDVWYPGAETQPYLEHAMQVFYKA